MNESDLIEQARAGDTEAFGRLIEAHQAHVRAYLGSYVRNRVVVDDLAQEVFISAFRTLATYKGNAPLIAWLIGIARHRRMTYLRDEARRQKREGCDFETAIAVWRSDEAEQGPDDGEWASRQAEALLHCIRQLPDHVAALVKRRYFQNEKLETIAQQIGKKAGTLRVALLRVRDTLRACVETQLQNAA